MLQCTGTQLRQCVVKGCVLEAVHGSAYQAHSRVCTASSRGPSRTVWCSSTAQEEVTGGNQQEKSQQKLQDPMPLQDAKADAQA
jgi:hypothetical protein